MPAGRLRVDVNARRRAGDGQLPAGCRDEAVGFGEQLMQRGLGEGPQFQEIGRQVPAVEDLT